MTVTTTATSTLKVTASAPGTFDVAGYGALSFTNVGEITNLGEFGTEFALVTHSPIGSRTVQKYKGSKNVGTMSMTLGLDTDDAGQILLKAAAASDNDYSFEVTTQNGDKYYFQAKVMMFKVVLGGVDDISAANVTLELTGQSGGTDIVESLAA